MLTRAGFLLLTTGSFLFLAAIPAGNLLLLTLSLVPLTFLLVASLGNAPRTIRTRLETPGRLVRIGETIPITVHYEIHGGRGVIELHQGLPGIFTLTEGNNLHLVVKDRGTVHGRYSFRVRVPRRGRFELPGVDWEHVGALGLTGSRRGQSGDGGTIEVRPALRIVRRIPTTKGRAAIPRSSEEQVAMGVVSTEFREIREYRHGDPPRSINWKATARLDARRRGRTAPQDTSPQVRPSGIGHEKKTNGRTDTNAPRSPTGPPAGPTTVHPPPHQLQPMVNEYEREGRNNTWVFLDCGPHMRVGTSAENAFEAAVAATIGVTGHLLSQGHRVGLTLYNLDEPLHVYPETGRRQLYVIQSTLAQAEPSDHTNGLTQAVAETKRFMIQSHTRSIIVTRAECDTDDLTEGIRLLEKTTARRRHRPRILIASIDPYALLPVEHKGAHPAHQVVRQRQKDKHKAIRALGAQLLVWDPTTRQFEEVIARRAMTR